MSSVTLGTSPASRLVKTFVLGVAAALLALAYMAAVSTGSASARDIFISDGANPVADPKTDQGDCAIPSFTTYDADDEESTNEKIQEALQSAVTPAVSGIAPGDTIYLCPISAGEQNIANEYTPEEGPDGTAVNLTPAPNNITIAAQPGADITLTANQENDDYNFFRNLNNQAFNFTLKGFELRQAHDEADVNGGFIQIRNATTPGTLTLEDIDANGFSVDGSGGVVDAENVIVRDSAFATDELPGGDPGFNEADDGSGGAIFARQNVTVEDSQFGYEGGENAATDEGGAISAGRNVTVTGSAFINNVSDASSGGAIYSSATPAGLNPSGVTITGSEFIGNGAFENGGAVATGDGGFVNVQGAPSLFSDNVSDTGDGGAIASDVVEVSNASLFGIDDLEDPETLPNRAVDGGGGAIYAGENATVSGGAAFTGNEADGDGGAIFSGGGIQVDGSGDAIPDFFGNVAGEDGGAIFVEGNIEDVAPPGADDDFQCVTPIEFTGNVRFNGNAASSDGGAIAVGGGASDGDEEVQCDVELNDSRFGGLVAAQPGNTAVGNGGAVSAVGGNVVTSSTTNFASNEAEDDGNGGDGGALWLSGYTSLTDRGATYAKNYADGDGGAINFDGDGAGMSSIGSTFTENESDSDGGAIHVNDATEAVVSGGTFSKNESADDGGAIRVNGAEDLEIADNTFSENVGNEGGAIETNETGATAATFNITGNVFNKNEAIEGGAISKTSGVVTISDNVFTENAAVVRGGAIENDLNTAVIEENVFVENVTEGDGGAIAHSDFRNAAPARPLGVTENFFVENAAEENGGAIFSDSIAVNGAAPLPALSFKENVFSLNAAEEDGGAVNYTTAGAGIVLMTEDVLSGNVALEDGGAIAVAGVGAVLNIGSLKAGELAIEDEGVDLVNNRSGGDGGAVWTNAAGTVILASTVGNNRNGMNEAGTAIADPEADGGAVYVDAGFHTLGASLYSGNQSADSGGAVFSNGDGSLAAVPQQGMVANTFLGNQAGAATAEAQVSAGGAVALTGDAPQNSLLNQYLLNQVVAGPDDEDSASVGGAVASLDTFVSQRDVYSLNGVAAAGGDDLAAGGAVFVEEGDLVAGNSTFSGNSSAGPAGVAWAADGDIDLTNTTLADNGSPLEGGSMLQTADGESGTITLTNNILSQGVGASSACLADELENGGGNVLTDTTACGDNAFVGGGGAPAAKVTAAQLDLKPLANNGNDPKEVPTLTRALGFDSVARASAGDCDLAILEDTGGDVVDQRGLERPDTNCSSGAYQLTLTDELVVTKVGDGRGTVASSPAGIDCGPDCDTQSAVFAQTPPVLTVTLTASAQAGSAFVSWSGSCAAFGSQATCEVTMDEARVATANFRNASRQLTVARTGNGEGTVTSGEGGPIDCGTACTANLAEGSSITLTAQATGQSRFDGWSGACASSGTSPTCTLTMDEAKTATANFTQTARVRVVQTGKAKVKVPRNRVITLGRVECVNGTCQVTATSASVKVRGRSFRAKVRVSRDAFSTGQNRTVKAVINKAAFKRLRRSRKTSGNIRVNVRAEANVPGSSTEVTRTLKKSMRR